MEERDVLPEEAEVLSELLRKSTWERYRDEFPREAFTSKNAKRLRTSIDHLHLDSVKDVIPLRLLKRASGVDGTTRLESPLPPIASHKKLEGKIIRAGVQEHMELLDKISDRDGVIGAEDILELHDWTSKVVHRGATNGARVETVEALTKRKKWGKPEFPTFLHRDLDKHFEGGVDRGDVCCLMSPYGHGKSTLLYIMSYRAALKHKVLFISCENHETQIARRMIQIHKQESKRRKTWPKFDVVYQNPLDVRGVRNFIEQGKYDIVYLDYYGNLDEAEVIDTTSARRTIRTLKQIAVSNNVCIWTAVQSHDPKEWQRSSQRTDLFGAKVVGQLCDCFIGAFINVDLNRIKFTVHKRRGPGRSGVDFNGDFDVDVPRLVER